MHPVRADIYFVAESLDTSLMDSIAVDTVPGHPRFATGEQEEIIVAEYRADSIAAWRAAHTGHAEGLAPRHLTPLPEGGQGVTAIMMGVLILAGFSGRAVLRAMRSYSHELVAVRGRENAFNDNRPVPVPVAMLLGVLFVVFGGIALCSMPWFGGVRTFEQIMATMGLLGAYYVFQLAAYGLVGYAFATPEAGRQWLEGFAAAQAFAGIGIVIPTLLAVCMPQWSVPCLYVCLGIYVALRCMFILKGFRIFYAGIGSLLYFILYLCTLEIVPVLCIGVAMTYIVG